MNNSATSVRFSRAGDEFHYRWAARRCLRMINPCSPLRHITVESSANPTAKGECVIDVAEYSNLGAENADEDVTDVAYYQLKHSSIVPPPQFTFVDAKHTLEQFAERYTEHRNTIKGTVSTGSVTFVIITNRPVSASLKNDIKAIGSNQNPLRKGFLEELGILTKLNSADLSKFCAALSFVDGEGDYVVQRRALHGEMQEYIAGLVETDKVDLITNLVRSRVLPDSKGYINREDILKCLGALHPKDLFPASPIFDRLEHPIKREQHDDLIRNIFGAKAPLIVTAEGGVGKTVVARCIGSSLPDGGVGIVYDCFGAGTYRNASSPRHTARVALVQIINELAERGLCSVLIPARGDVDSAYFQAFLDRLEQASKKLREARPNAFLVIIIDAADNAEMVAEENGERSFARSLLSETIPAACRLVMFCRPERKKLIDPLGKHFSYSLLPFTPEETTAHLRSFHPQADMQESSELHRLTGGNPRVQASALSVSNRSLTDTLHSLGPQVTTVSDQINAQLKGAIINIKERQDNLENSQIDAICQGLANLPPYIPINVLAAAAGVSASAIKSFVADLGRPLWYTDDSVQFRDEPTETWFRENYAATIEQVSSYVGRLEPLASKHPYAARALPILLHKSQCDDRLISLAVSEDLLPSNNPIERRNIRIYRLQFAFKAALRQKRHADAIRLALRAGEEVAGDTRLIELLSRNTDLIAPLQDSHRVQEFAYRRVFFGNWEGSENVYSAALLSSVNDFKGEARGYLRSAKRWLSIYFHERDKKQKLSPDSFHDEEIKDEDIVALATIHYNLDGPNGFIEFIRTWSPPEFIVKVTQGLISNLIDAGKFSEIDKIALLGAKILPIILGLTSALSSVAHFPPMRSLRPSLDSLSRKRKRIPKPDHASLREGYPNRVLIIAFAEACAVRRLQRKKIIETLRYYAVEKVNIHMGGDHREEERHTLFRGIALSSALARNYRPDYSTLIPRKKVEEHGSDDDSREEQKRKEAISSLLPWHIARARLLIGGEQAKNIDFAAAQRESTSIIGGRYRGHDMLPYEVARIHLETLLIDIVRTVTPRYELIHDLLKSTDPKLSLRDRLVATRMAFRTLQLVPLRESLELSCAAILAKPDPEERAGQNAEDLIMLARAVLPANQPAASAYFDKAVDAVSKFGDEMIDRWHAVVAIAKRAAQTNNTPEALAYRFIRCAEVIGNHVYKEKYWNRNEVFCVAAQLHLPAAIAGISRWRDRGVGNFDEQLLALGNEIVSKGKIAPTVGWALSAFQGCNKVEFASLCIQIIVDKRARKRLFGCSIRDLQLNGGTYKDWEALVTLGKKLSIDTTLAEKELSGARQNDRGRRTANEYRLPPIAPFDWSAFFEKTDLLTTEGVEQSIASFAASESRPDNDVFWNELISRIPSGKEMQFIAILLSSEKIDSFDIRNAIRVIKSTWMQKIAVKNHWSDFLRKVGKKFHDVFISIGQQSYWMHLIPLDEAEIHQLAEGAAEGLGDVSEVVGASAFFCFATNTTSHLAPIEATQLLDYALSRFELHIDGTVGDGPWTNDLEAPANHVDAFTGIIWAALGSPYSAIRWQAAHAVRRLVENHCEAEVTSLFKWLEADHARAYTCEKYPFYNLHARLYLMIALARASKDEPAALRPYRDVFLRIALREMPHALLQKLAAEIALKINESFPDTYTKKEVRELIRVGVSRFPVKKITRKEKAILIDTPWHKQGTIKLDLDYPIYSEFNWYWFDSLSHIFGPTVKQIEDLARQSAIEDLKIRPLPNGTHDPRHYQESYDDYDRTGTYHSHGSYPINDDFAFYSSYHTYHAAAAKLFQNMPVLEYEQSWFEDTWDRWLARHSLTRSDGYWLSDRRDSMPQSKPSWLNSKAGSDWRWEIAPENFFEGILDTSDEEKRLCIAGYWQECDESHHSEKYHVMSALVSSRTSRALAEAMRTSEDPYRFGLPPYQEEDSEDSTEFNLTGWICSPGEGNRLDQFDPISRKIPFPPYTLGPTFLKKLRLHPDPHLREWRKQGISAPSLISKLWSDKPNSRREFTKGHRLSASIAMLQDVCHIYKKEIIISIEIERKTNESFRSRSSDEQLYIPPYHKVFIFSADGILKDTTKNYPLGKTTRPAIGKKT